MHHHDWSSPTDGAPDLDFDDPSGATDHAAHLAEPEVPQLAVPAEPHGYGQVSPGDHAGAFDTHRTDPGAIEHAEPPAWQLHVDHLSVVAAERIDVNAAPHGDGGGHHDVLSLAADSGWLEPSSPLMALAGTVFTGAIGARLKRVGEPRTGELERRIERGERVFVALDADELDRAGGRDDRMGDLRAIPGQGAARPVEVLGVRSAGPDGLAVDLDDPDGPLGRHTLPLRAFEAAWEGSGRLAYTSAAAPDHGDRPSNDPRSTSQ